MSTQNFHGVGLAGGSWQDGGELSVLTLFCVIFPEACRYGLALERGLALSSVIELLCNPVSYYYRDSEALQPHMTASFEIATCWI
jgi:hypothetical protein